MTTYLVDTSVWIRHLRGNAAVTTRLADAVSRGDVLVSCGPVAMELLAGINARNQRVVDTIVQSTPPLAFDHREDFVSAARLSVIARERGLVVRSLVDCLIAAIAIRDGEVVVAHCDTDFDRLAEVSPLRAERWADVA